MNNSSEQKPLVWIEVNECPQCKSKNIKWHLSATKECKDCSNVFRAEILINAE